MQEIIITPDLFRPVLVQCQHLLQKQEMLEAYVSEAGLFESSGRYKEAYVTLFETLRHLVGQLRYLFQNIYQYLQLILETLEGVDHDLSVIYRGVQ